MYCQLIRVISSPSSSRTGLVTFLLALALGPLGGTARYRARLAEYPRGYSTGKAPAAAKGLCSFGSSFSRECRHHVSCFRRQRKGAATLPRFASEVSDKDSKTAASALFRLRNL